MPCFSEGHTFKSICTVFDKFNTVLNRSDNKKKRRYKVGWIKKKNGSGRNRDGVQILSKHTEQNSQRTDKKSKKI